MACYRRKSTVLQGKLIESKKTPKNSVFWRTNMGITSLWEDLEAKSLGYNGSNELLGRSVASKLSLQQADKKKSRANTQIREKRKFFSLRPPA